MYDLYEFYIAYQDKLWVALLGLIVFGVMYGVKYPIKLLNKKYIPEKYQKLFNKVIILITFGFGILAQYIYSVITHGSLNIVEGVGAGSAALSLYAIVERSKKNDEAKASADEIDTQKESVGEVVGGAAKEILADGKITKEDGAVALSAIEKLFKETEQINK